MATTIMVPLVRPEEDRDNISELALPVARMLAEGLGNEVVLVAVLELPADEDEAGNQVLIHAADDFPNDHALLKLKDETDAMVGALQVYLDTIAATMPGRRTSTIVRYGDPKEQLINVAERLEDPIIVMTSHARRGIQRALLGSVAFGVVSGTPAPVLIVPAHVNRETTVLDHVVVPLDGSELAEQGVRRGLAALAPAKLHVHLTQVIERLSVRSGVVADEYYALALDEAREYLPRIAEEIRAMGHECGWTVTTGIAADQIIALANDKDADLILMTTFGRTGFRRVVMGSVAGRVLHSAERPVMLVRATPEN